MSRTAAPKRSEPRQARSRALPSESQPVLRPPLKWAGGKRWQVQHLRELWEPHRHKRLVEPFCGGLAVTLGLNPTRALLNDVNPHVINLYRWLKRGLDVTLLRPRQTVWSIEIARHANDRRVLEFLIPNSQFLIP